MGKAAGLGAGRRRVVVAMSGGVDSSVAAALLVEAGHEVIGVSMRTHVLPAKSNRACCTPDDMRDARRVAQTLGIPFYLLAYEDVFAREVVAPFVAAYRAGRTPNPCVACNDRVKFAPLLAQAKTLGADALATGHYARRAPDGAGGYDLLRARDANKDQTYFLYRLKAHQLAELWFPLGELSKEEVRAHARRLGLGEQVAAKAESQEICFVGPRGYAAVVEAHGGGEALPAQAKRNVLIDERGRVLGKHAGVHHFTIGQRRGLGVAAPEPLYVLHIDAARGEVVLGPRARLLTRAMTLGSLSWTSGTGEPPAPGCQVAVQLRHRGQTNLATVLSAPLAELRGAQPAPLQAAAEATGEPALHLAFAEPTERAAPGQAAVLYQGERVLGGGVIARAAEPPARLAVVHG